MNTKFTILIAAGLLFAGVSQAQDLAYNNGKDIRNVRHEMVNNDHRTTFDNRDHKNAAPMAQPHRKVVKHHHKKVVRHHHKVVRHHGHN